jgi:hypothetical protein
MQCPSCKGSISAYNFFREKTCPACGEKLKKMPTWDQVKESVISFAEDKGYIFWSIVYLVATIVIAFLEQIFGSGRLLDWTGDHQFRFLFFATLGGQVIDYIARANVEVTAVRNKFIFKPPRYLRNYRRMTNFMVMLGLAVSAYAMYEYPNYLEPMPIITLCVAILVCFGWAIMGIFLTEDDMNDKRIRYFMEEMRIGRVRYYNRMGAIYIGATFLCGVLYYKLVTTSGLWFYIYNSRFVYDVMTFWKQYFGWVKAFARN